MECRYPDMLGKMIVLFSSKFKGIILYSSNVNEIGEIEESFNPYMFKRYDKGVSIYNNTYENKLCTEWNIDLI